MSKNLELKVSLSAIDKMSAPIKAAMSGFEKLSVKVKQSQAQIDGFNKIQQQVEQFSKLREETNRYAKSLLQAKANVLQLEGALAENEKRYKSSKGSLGRSTQLINENRAKLKELTVVYNNMIRKGYKHTVGYGSIQDIRLEIDGVKKSIKSATEEQKKYKAETKELETIVGSVKKSFKGESDAVKKLERDYSSNINHLKKLQVELNQAGFDTKDFSGSQSKLATEIKQTNKALNQQKNALNIAAKAKNAWGKVKANLDNNYQLGQKIGTVGFGANLAGKNLLRPAISMGRGVAGMAQTAGKFEQLQSVLEITEGSSEKAKKSLEWVKQFAVDTPANVDEAAEAFVRLRAYGMDPTNGLLMSLGDTAAAMGKPVMQAVEAIADAVTGENERLKEFGIKGSVVKGKNIIEYQYTDKNGKQQIAKVNKNDRKKIEETLKRIFNEKYSGAMEKQSKTLMGIWSKLEDVWTNFQLKIMESGAFDWIKNKLQGVLDLFDKAEKSGELQLWANDIGTVIKEVAQGFWECGEAMAGLIKAVSKFARENKGVIATLIKWVTIIGAVLTALSPFLLALAIALPLLSSLSSGVWVLIKAFGKLSLAMLTTPLGWIVLAIGGLIAAIYLLWKHWSIVKQALIDGWNWVKKAFVNNPILEVIQPIVPILKEVVTAISNWDVTVDKVTKSISNKFENLANVVDGMFNSIKNSITDTFNKAMEFLGLETRLGKVKIGNIAEPAMVASNTANALAKTVLEKVPSKSSGGYAGNGGKYQPMGVYHGGEYIMTKEATSRLGVPLLNALNYGKQAAAVSMLGIGVATAQPIKIDNRPPLSAKPAPSAVVDAPMNVTININATQGQKAVDIAREVQKELARLENQKQARHRAALRDRE